jgi:hypothetical protein
VKEEKNHVARGVAKGRSSCGKLEANGAAAAAVFALVFSGNTSINLFAKRMSPRRPLSSTTTIQAAANLCHAPGNEFFG